MESKLSIRHLRTDYPSGENRIKQLEKGGSKLVPCTIEADDDYYSFTYDLTGLRKYDSVLSASAVEKYGSLLCAAELSELADNYSFTLDPGNIMVDAAYRPRILERNFRIKDMDFISEYKALIGTTVDPAHSFEDFLKGGDDLFEQSSFLSGIAAAGSADEVRGILTEAVTGERRNNEENYLPVKKAEYRRLKRLLPVFGIIMLLALGLFAYDYFVVGRENRSVIEASNLYFAEDYKSVGKELAWADPEKLSDASRYIAAVSAIKSSGLNAEQKETLLKTTDQYRTNRDYLNYWVCIGRQDYEEADQYAQKFRDNEHRVFALALRRSQIEKDSGISGSEKTEMINEIDEEIKQLLESINESSYGLTDSGSGEAATEENEASDKEQSADNEEKDSAGTDAAEEEPKLLN